MPTLRPSLCIGFQPHDVAYGRFQQVKQTEDDKGGLREEHKVTRRCLRSVGGI